MSLGERLKQLRKTMNMTQVEFGAFIGVSGATVSTSESGKSIPDNQTIELICMKCGVSREWLVDGVVNNHDKAPTLGERIHLIRKKNCMSMRVFGDAIGISAASISKIETGVNNPSEQTIRAICAEFDVSREWLLAGTGSMNVCSALNAPSTLGERVYLIRRKNELTQAEFGERIGITLSSVSLIEKGKNNPSEQTIRAICSEFRVNRAWLENGDGDMGVNSRPATDLLKDIHSYSNALRLLEEFASMSSEEWLAFKTLLEQFFGHHTLK